VKRDISEIPNQIGAVSATCLPHSAQQLEERRTSPAER
jgi:hypothetical protein